MAYGSQRIPRDPRFALKIVAHDSFLVIHGARVQDVGSGPEVAVRDLPVGPARETEHDGRGGPPIEGENGVPPQREGVKKTFWT